MLLMIHKLMNVRMSIRCDILYIVFYYPFLFTCFLKVLLSLMLRLKTKFLLVLILHVHMLNQLESKFDFFSHFSISDLHSDKLQETELIKPVANLTNNPNAEFVPMPIVTRTIHKNVFCAIPYSTNFVKRSGWRCSTSTVHGFAQCVMKLKRPGQMKISSLKRKTPMIYKKGPFGLERKKLLLLEDIRLKNGRRQLI